MARKTYEGASVDVSFDPDVCEHSAVCLRGLPAVFNVDARPWIQPDQADPTEVVNLVGKCPSGALCIERQPDQ